MNFALPEPEGGWELYASQKDEEQEQQSSIEDRAPRDDHQPPRADPVSDEDLQDGRQEKRGVPVDNGEDGRSSSPDFFDKIPTHDNEGLPLLPRSSREVPSSLTLEDEGLSDHRKQAGFNPFNITSDPLNSHEHSSSKKDGTAKSRVIHDSDQITGREERGARKSVTSNPFNASFSKSNGDNTAKSDPCSNDIQVHIRGLNNGGRLESQNNDEEDDDDGEKGADEEEGTLA